MKPRRYQLSKEALRVVESGHPWIYRNRLSSAAAVLFDGDWLELVDGNNAVVGTGLYHAEGLIGIRMLGAGAGPLPARLARVLARRDNLRKFTNAYRAVHGDNDGIPGVVADVYGENLILQTYSTAADPLGRWVARWLSRELALKNVIWKQPARRRGSTKEQRILRGNAPSIVEVREGKLSYSVDLGSGQKSGAFLDLRGLRKWIALQKWAGYRVLNLFSYSGTLGLAAEAAGAKEVLNVDVSQGALDFAKEHNALKPGVQKYLAMDVFEELPKRLAASERYDVIIVDPPSMASEMGQVPAALRSYRRIYRQVVSNLSARGILIGGCCTSRISRAEFRRVLDETTAGKLKMRHSLASEDDHPVGFAEGDYLKLFIYSS